MPLPALMEPCCLTAIQGHNETGPGNSVVGMRATV